MAKKLLKDMTYQELMSEAAANSEAWHGAPSATQDALHQRNQAIYSLADAKFGTQSDFNGSTGEWSHGGGITDPQYVYDNYERLYGKADSGRRGVGGYRNQSYSEWKQGGEYQALMDTYRQQADTAMQDVLGQLSARTGGLASSYASAAAAQQYNDIMARLEAVARQMYEGDRAAAMDEYEINRAAADTAYDRAVYERAYNDAKTLQEKQEEAAAEEAARARVLEYFTGMGGTSAGADEAMRALIARSGYTDAELAAMEKNYATLMALQRQKASGSGGGTTGKPRLTAAQTMEAINKGIINDRTRAAFEYWYGQPYSPEEGNGDGTGGPGDTPPTPEPESEGEYNPANFERAMTSLSTLLAQGNEEAALSGLDSIWNKLSYAQQVAAQRVLGGYGIAYQEA